MAKTRIKKTRSPKRNRTIPRGTGHPVPDLTGSLLQFDLPAETERLRQGDPWETTSRNAKTLVKYPDLRVVLIAMKAGTRMAGHKADGSISLQALTGRLCLHLPEQAIELSEGLLAVLERSLPHDVEALEDCSFLLTIAWPRGA